MIEVQRRTGLAGKVLCRYCRREIKYPDVYVLTQRETSTPGMYLVSYAHLRCDQDRRMGRGREAGKH